MYQSTEAQFQSLISFNTASFSGSYQLAGTLAAPARIMIMVNGSNVAVTVSTDGVTDHAYFGASNATPQQFNFGDNRGNAASTLVLPQGTPIYVKGSAGTGIFAVSYVAAVTPSTQVPL